MIIDLLNEAFNNAENSFIFFSLHIVGQAKGSSWITVSWSDDRKIECLFALYPEPTFYLPDWNDYEFPINKKKIAKSTLIIEGEINSVKCVLADPQFFETVGARLRNQRRNPYESPLGNFSSHNPQ